jgi:molybdate transport system regulatory protein
VKLSARNQLRGTVKSVTEGAVMAEVVVSLQGGGEVVAAITLGAERSLGLAQGAPVSAVIKATDVLLGIDGDDGLVLSARNQLRGTVSAVKAGVVTAEVQVALDGGLELTSVITVGSLEALGLSVGQPVVAVIKATEVMIATHAS